MKMNALQGRTFLLNDLVINSSTGAKKKEGKKMSDIQVFFAWLLAPGILSCFSRQNPKTEKTRPAAVGRERNAPIDDSAERMKNQQTTGRSTNGSGR